MMLSIFIIAMSVYFARVGIDAHRRGFTSANIAIAIGATVALDLAASWVVVTWLRRRASAACNYSADRNL